MSITYSYNHEGNWAAACLSVLRAGGTAVPTVNIQIAQSMTISRTPRIEVEVEADERASEQMGQIRFLFPWRQDFAVSGGAGINAANSQYGYKFNMTAASSNYYLFIGNITSPTFFCGVSKADSTTWPIVIDSGTEAVPGSPVATISQQFQVVTYYAENSSIVEPVGEWYFSHRAATILTRCVTNRTAESAQNHGNIRAKVRYLYSREAQKFVTPTVTIYQTLDVQELGSNVFVRDPESDREDVTEFRHRIEYGILPTTVPTI